MGALQCQSQHPQNNQEIKKKQQLSTERLRDQLIAFGQKHNLQKYSQQSQLIIQKLFLLKQKKACNKLLQFQNEKQYLSKIQLTQSLQKVDFQHLDNIVFKMKYQKQKLMEEVIKQNQQQHIRLKELILVQQFNNQNYQNYKDAGLQMLRSNNVTVIAFIECFTGIGCLKMTRLPTKKTFLSIFLDKTQAFTQRYGCPLVVVFVINEQKIKEFKVAMHEYTQNKIAKYSCDDLHYHQVIFTPHLPCIDAEGEVIIKQDLSLQYYYESGDIVKFFHDNPQIRDYLKKNQFIYCANIMNLLQNIADPFFIGVLVHQTLIDMIAKVCCPTKENNENIDLENNILVVNNYFIVSREAEQNQQPMLLTNSYLFRSSIFTATQISFQKIILSRYRLEALPDHTFYFKRSFEDILYKPLTGLVLADEIFEYAHLSNHQLAYSRYCKKFLGITDSPNYQMIEVCPELLFGPKNLIKEVIEEINSKQVVGFPLIISKNSFTTS